MNEPTNNQSLKAIQSAMIMAVTGQKNPGQSCSSKDVQQILEISNIGIYKNDVLRKRLNQTTAIYPILRKLLGKQFKFEGAGYWTKNPSRAKTPVKALAKLPQHLRTERPDLLNQYPFIADLAEFEYCQMQVWIDNSLKRETTTEAACPENGERFVKLNPTMIIKSYNHPVAQIAELIESSNRRRFKYDLHESHIAIYQDPQTNLVSVQELGDTVLRLLEAVQNKVLSEKELANVSLAQLPTRKRRNSQKQVITLIQQMKSVGMIIAA